MRKFVLVIALIVLAISTTVVSADVIGRTCSASPILLYDIVDGEMSVVGHISGAGQVNLLLDVFESYTDSEYRDLLRVRTDEAMTLISTYVDLEAVFVQRSALVFSTECLPGAITFVKSQRELIRGTYVACSMEEGFAVEPVGLRSVRETMFTGGQSTLITILETRDDQTVYYNPVGSFYTTLAPLGYERESVSTPGVVYLSNGWTVGDEHFVHSLCQITGDKATAIIDEDVRIGLLVNVNSHDYLEHGSLALVTPGTCSGHSFRVIGAYWDPRVHGLILNGTDEQALVLQGMVAYVNADAWSFQSSDEDPRAEQVSYQVSWGSIYINGELYDVCPRY